MVWGFFFFISEGFLFHVGVGKISADDPQIPPTHLLLPNPPSFPPLSNSPPPPSTLHHHSPILPKYGTQVPSLPKTLESAPHYPAYTPPKRNCRFFFSHLRLNQSAKNPDLLSVAQKRGRAARFLALKATGLARVFVISLFFLFGSYYVGR